jgi:glucan phosphoethanolaminetransferase (alkaline phosphatase superfamily)
MSTITTSAIDRPAAIRTAVVAAALVGAIGSAAFISSVIFMPDISNKDAATHPLVQTAEILIGLSFVVLALALPSLAEISKLPRWALYVAAGGCAFVATNAWTYGLFMAHVSRQFTDAQAEAFQNADSGYLTAYVLPKMILCGVGLPALAIVGWRRRAIARPACVLLVLAAIVSGLLAAYPPGAFLAAVAIAWMARTAAVSGDTSVGDRGRVARRS